VRLIIGQGPGPRAGGFLCLSGRGNGTNTRGSDPAGCHSPGRGCSRRPTHLSRQPEHRRRARGGRCPGPRARLRLPPSRHRASPSRAPPALPSDGHRTAGKGASVPGPAIYRDWKHCSHWLRGSQFLIGCFFLRHCCRLAWFSSRSHRLLPCLRQAEPELRRCHEKTSDGGRAQWRSGFRREGPGVVAREPMGRRKLGGRVVAANGRACSVPGRGGARRRRLRGGHDAELLSDGLRRPRQRPQPGARHLLPPVSAAAPRGGAPRPALASFSLSLSACRRFPVDAAQRRAWIRAVNRVDPRSRQAWRPGPGAILCSRHFAEADFERYGLRRKLRRGAVPSRFPHPVRAVTAAPCPAPAPRRSGAR